VNCSFEGCEAPVFDHALIDGQPYCAEHYPDAARYDTAVEKGSVLCEVCHELRPSITFFGSIRQWRCRDHHPNADKSEFVTCHNDPAVHRYLNDCWELL